MKPKDMFFFLIVLVGIPVLIIIFPTGFTNSRFETSLWLIGGIVYFIIAIWFLKNSTPVKNQILSILIRIIYAFLYLIVFMGSIYFMISKNDPKAFVFVNSLREKENKTELISNNYDSILILEEKIYLLSKIYEKSDSIFSLISQSGIKSYESNGQGVELQDSSIIFNMIGDLKFKLYRFCPYDTVSKFDSYGVLSVYSNGIKHMFYSFGNNVDVNYVTSLLGIIDVSDFKIHIIKMIRQYNVHIHRINLDLVNKIKNTNNGNIFDYMYLSAMTTTTLGFGDILPNDGFSRIAITIHAILSVLFLAFSAIIISDKRKKEGSEKDLNK